MPVARECAPPLAILIAGDDMKILYRMFLAAAVLSTASNAQASPEASLIYSYQEMQSFDLKGYLKKNAPYLANQSETISHWAGYTSISPKVLLTLIEVQTSGISSASSYVTEHPFGQLSVKTSFSDQVGDVATRLADAYYRELKAKQPEPAARALAQVLPKTKASLAFTEAYTRLFGQKVPALSDRQQAAFAAADQPPADLLQLPFPVGESWNFGGSHTNTGSGTYPQSSLDMNNGGYWGSDTSNKWVVASAEGRAIRHSSCLVEVVHPGGWSTTYYHLSNVRIQTNQQVTKNQRLANYASNINQALCNGGHSSGPHQHFSLKRDGRYHHLNDVALSGYQVHTGRYSYDSNCAYFWLQRNGQKYCTGYRLLNPGTPSNDVPLLRNGQPAANLAASKDSEKFYRLEVPAGAKNLYFRIYGGSGDADMHVLRGAKPSLSRYDCRPFTTTQDELCRYPTPTAGTWYILLHAFSNYQGISLQAGYELNSQARSMVVLPQE